MENGDIAFDVEESGLHLLDLINEILDMAKIETGTASLKLSEVKVAELCDSCLDLVAPQAARKAIKLSFINSTSNLPLLHACLLYTSPSPRD